MKMSETSQHAEEAQEIDRNSRRTPEAIAERIGKMTNKLAERAQAIPG